MSPRRSCISVTTTQQGKQPAWRLQSLHGIEQLLCQPLLPYLDAFGELLQHSKL